MKRILLVFILAIISTFSLLAQRESSRIVTGRCNLQQTGGGAGYWEVSGNFTDGGGLYESSDVLVGDFVYFTDGGIGFYLPITLVVSATPPSFVVRVDNTGITAVSAVPTTNSAYICRGTANYDFMPFVANISDPDNQVSQEDFIYRLDSILYSLNILSAGNGIYGGSDTLSQSTTSVTGYNKILNIIPSGPGSRITIGNQNNMTFFAKDTTGYIGFNDGQGPLIDFQENDSLLRYYSRYNDFYGRFSNPATLRFWNTAGTDYGKFSQAGTNFSLLGYNTVTAQSELQLGSTLSGPTYLKYSSIADPTIYAGLYLDADGTLSQFIQANSSSTAGFYLPGNNEARITVTGGHEIKVGATLTTISATDSSDVLVRLSNSKGNADIFLNSATPESAISGSSGDLAVSTTGEWYIKETGNATTTGWVKVSTVTAFFGDCTAGNVTLTLPAPSIGAGRKYEVIKEDVTSNPLIVSGTFLSGSQKLIYHNQVVFIESNGTNWYLTN